MSRENVEIVRRLFEAQARHDLDAIEDLYDPSIEWDDVSGLWGDWGERRGRDGVRATPLPAGSRPSRTSRSRRRTSSMPATTSWSRPASAVAVGAADLPLTRASRWCGL